MCGFTLSCRIYESRRTRLWPFWLNSRKNFSNQARPNHIFSDYHRLRFLCTSCPIFAFLFSLFLIGERKNSNFTWEKFILICFESGLSYGCEEHNFCDEALALLLQEVGWLPRLFGSSIETQNWSLALLFSSDKHGFSALECGLVVLSLIRRWSVDLLTFKASDKERMLVRWRRGNSAIFDKSIWALAATCFSEFGRYIDCQPFGNTIFPSSPNAMNSFPGDREQLCNLMLHPFSISHTYFALTELHILLGVGDWVHFYLF